ncbi:MAG: right-handed parallel beta-helix repeat-containing protein [Nitrososphaerota archaeon]|jgi:hypothetical protein|nr:right-handed parallel beta-helix repeat-containing protein [Nitrososphaerota archaeon]
MIQLFKRSNQSIVLIVLLIAGFSLIGTTVSTYAQQPSPTLIYVSAGGSNTSGNGSMANPYATIQYAVNVAPPQAVIIVEPGAYNEMINVTKSLTIESLSGQPSNTIINATGQTFGIIVSGPATIGTTINGFTILGAASHGIFVEDSSSIVIEHNILTHDGVNATLAQKIPEDKAIELVGTSNSTVVGNTVIDSVGGGIGVSDNGPINPGYIDSGVPSVASDNVISSNWIINTVGGCGIVISSYDAGEGVIGNIVTGNILVSDFSSIIIAADLPNTQALNNTVSYNTILNTGEAGVVIHSNAPGDVVDNNMIIGNTISADGDPFSVPNIPIYTGILVGGEGPVPVKNTVISSNAIDKETYGVAVINGIGTQVLSNNIFTQSVKIPVNGTTIISSAITQINGNISNLRSYINSLSSEQGQLLSSVDSLQSSAATTSQVNSLSSSLGTTTDVAYLSLIVALVLGIIAIALALRRK